MIATRFAVAVHILLLLSTEGGGQSPVTSFRLAASIETNPVVVRRITGQLARAGLIRTRRGPGGAGLARPPDTITLADVWEAVNADHSRPLLPLHAGSEALEARRIQRVLSEAFASAEHAFRGALAGTTLAELTGRMRTAALSGHGVPSA